MRVVLAAAAALLFAGCAPLSGGTVAPSAPFDLLGRVLAGADGRAFSAAFRWRHEMPLNEIWLMSPTGTTLAHISSDAAGATLTTADQQEYHAFSAEGLTRRALGWALPLAQLQYWVRGEMVPDVATDVLERDARGRLVRLEQAGWSLRFTYAEGPAQSVVPRRLDLEQAGQRIRMVIDDWRERDPQ
ncbi:MAG: lipoprotein insertase outer membrane protein LolB [Burkholderiales bacterium]|nr:lipoprotein insertase outer membrane protein LolB [Burkholderiales bacterium]